MEDTKTIILGDEYDDLLIEKLKLILKNEGGTILSKNQDLGGSQEINEYSILLNGIILKLEIETYIGISLTGPTNIIDFIVKKIDNFK